MDLFVIGPESRSRNSLRFRVTSPYNFNATTGIFAFNRQRQDDVSTIGMGPLFLSYCIRSQYSDQDPNLNNFSYVSLIVRSSHRRNTIK